MGMFFDTGFLRNEFLPTVRSLSPRAGRGSG
jgi:hypothetical protein